MARAFFLFILILASFTGYSQADQVITLQGDTLTGKALVSTGSSNNQTIILKNGKNKRRFNVYEIKSMLRDDKEYHTIKINNKYQLGLLKKAGYLSLYEFTDYEEISSREYSSSILIKMDGTQLIIPNLGFKKQLNKFLSDCEAVKLAFAEKAYKQSDLEKIIDDYNNCIAENTAIFNEKRQ